MSAELWLLAASLVLALVQIGLASLSAKKQTGIDMMHIPYPGGGPSQIGLIAATMQGSTETTFYVLTVYFGAVGIRKIRHCLPAALVSDLAGFLVSVLIVRLIFG